MKKIKLLAMPICLLPTIATGLMTSCEKKQTIGDRKLEITEFNSVNYCLGDGVRESAPFITDLHNFKAGDKIDVTLQSSENITLCKDNNPSEHVNMLSYTIDANTTSISPRVTVKDSELFDEIRDYEFSLTYSIRSVNGGKGSVKISNLYLSVCIGTTQDMFLYTTEDDTKTLTGINSEKEDDFNKCNFLVIPSDVDVIGDNAFYNNGTTLIPNIQYLMLDGTWQKGTPEITQIGVNAFEFSPIRGMLYIPPTVETIDNNAFTATNINQIVFGKDQTGQRVIQTIGDYAFSNLPNLQTSIEIPNTVYDIKHYAFYHTPFSGLTFEPGNDTKELWIGKSAFQYQSTGSSCGRAFGSLVLPPRIRQIGGYAFREQGFNYIYGTENFKNANLAFYYPFGNSFRLHGEYFLYRTPETPSTNNYLGYSRIGGLHIDSNEHGQTISIPAGNCFYKLRELKTIDLINSTPDKITVNEGCFKLAGEDTSSSSSITILINKTSSEADWKSKGFTQLYLQTARPLVFKTGVRVNIDKTQFQHVSIGLEGNSVFAVEVGTKWRQLKDKMPPVIPESGYKFKYWTVDGQQIDDNYVFNDTTNIVPYVE